NRLKYRGLLQRYNEKKDWLETELFQERYIPKIEKGLKVRGLSNINSLLELYTGYYDTLYQDIKKYGVRTKFENGECIDPLYIHIYKDGEILFTSDGNHRLFIYHLLGYKKIPVRVWMRHKQWQEKKETLFNSLQSENIITDKKLLDHPDLKEILKVFQSKVK
ncbi:MAG: hypothetical protein JJU37_17075, partial [Balneolaceae bacterium]|nr:hypothetical protein [Balneolaceae bacterium]